MHYKNGREAKVGDLVVGKDWQGLPLSGIIVKAMPGAKTCNVHIAPITTVIQNQTSSDLMHVDDALTVAATDPDPASPEA